jgi:cytochrome c oxidase subunit II
MSALEPGGPQAETIASLWDVFLWISVAVWVLVVAFLAIAAARARVRAGTGGPVASLAADPLGGDPARDRRLVRGVIAAGALTVAVLIGLLVASIAAGAALADLEDEPGAIHVRITGRQWWWQIDYEPEAPERTAVTANELHVPVGRPVHLELTSSDVIHSFWVPSLHGKRDLIPGRVNRTWIRADEPGTYRGQCAEFCGLEHARMALTVIAEPQADFDAWLARQREPAAEPQTDAQRRGQRVFLGAPCALCHTIAGTQAGGRLGPDLTHFAGRTTIGAGAVPSTVGHLAGWIADPQAIKPGARMPAISLPPDDLLALVAYLETLQ